MKVLLLLILLLNVSYTPQAKLYTRQGRPLITFYRDRFGTLPQDNHAVWRVSLKLDKPVKEPHTFFIAWKLNDQFDWKDSINVVAGQSFRTKELYMPYDESDVIKDVKLFQEETEMPAEVKFKR